NSGGFLAGHASHQNGLDADLSYFRVDHREQIPGTGDGFDESFVVDGKITPNFDSRRNWELIQFMVSSGIVTRIFVDPMIKHTLCQWAGTDQNQSITETLRVLRPYSNHRAHMHVRIACPKESPRCTAQVPPPPGDGCGEVETNSFGIIPSLAERLFLKIVGTEIPE
ncbi:MAG: penicillin-insensitive murein endopeptidase, partial [Bdellovibrionota bacterium]